MITMDFDELYSEPQNDSSSHYQRRELFLDTKGHCFLCLRDTENTSNVVMSEVCLRNICRYLDITCSSIILKSLKGDLSTEDEKEDAALKWGKCDFAVMLCSPCSSLTLKLSEMIRELEILEMRLKYKMQSFHRILCQAEDDWMEPAGISRLIRFQDKLWSDCENPMESRLVENLWAETKSKTADKVKRKSTCQPKLVLKRLSSNATGTGAVIISHVISTNTHFTTQETTDKLVLNGESANDVIIGGGSGSDHNTATRSTCVTPTLSEENEESSSNYSDATVRKFVSDMFPNYFEKLDPGCRKSLFRSRCVCLICKLTYPCEYAQVHLAMEHVHVLFKHKKPENVSWKIFNGKCKRLLDLEIQSATPKHPGDSFTCPYCAVKSRNRREGPLRLHLVSEHYHILEMKLARSLQNPEGEPGSVEPMVDAGVLTSKTPVTEKRTKIITLPRKRPPYKRTKICRRLNWANFYHKIEHSSKAANRFKCEICSSVHNKLKIRYHLVMKHSEKIFEGIRAAHVPKDKFKEHCSKMMRLATIQSGKKGKAEKSTDLKWMCSFCRLDFVDELQLKYHVVAAHYRPLVGVLLTLQNGKKPGRKFLSKLQGQKTKRRVTCNKIGGGCGMSFVNYCDLIIHKSKSCTPKRNLKMFPPKFPGNGDSSGVEIRDPHGSTNNYSDPAVRKFVADMFPNYLEKLDKSSTKALFRCRCVCRICRSVYLGYSARHHLVKEHVQVLFQHKRPASVSLEVFNDSCRRLLQAEINAAVRVGPVPSTSLPIPVLCQYCSIQFSDNILRYHLVTEHYHILERKLDSRLQQGTGDHDAEGVMVNRQSEMPVVEKSLNEHEMLNTEQIKDNAQFTQQLESDISIQPTFTTTRPTPNWKNLFQELEDTSIPNRFKCVLCGSLQNRFQIRHHLVARHAENVLVDARVPHVSQQEFSKHCVELLERVTSQTDEEISEEEKFTQGNGNWFCSICSKSFPDQFQLKHHMVASHYGAIARKLVFLQVYGTEAVDRLTQRMRNKKKSEHIAAFKCSSVYGGCGLRFHTSFELKKHQAGRCKTISKGSGSPEIVVPERYFKPAVVGNQVSRELEMDTDSTTATAGNLTPLCDQIVLGPAPVSTLPSEHECDAKFEHIITGH